MPVTVFYKDEVIARGSPAEFAGALRELGAVARSSDLLAFDDETGAQVDLDLTGEIPPPRPRGRPPLGVEAREVTLLPRHWDRLSAQPGGASVALRKLIDETRRTSGDRDRSRAARDAAYHFMSAMAGNLPNFEEASRALFAGDRRRLAGLIAGWPEDIREHIVKLAFVAFSSEVETGSREENAPQQKS